MKKVLSLLFLSLVLNGCDDGDIEVQSINFDSVEAVKCSLNNVIYKTKGTESLILQLSDASYATAFKENATTANTTININLDSSNKVIYRSYNGPISTDNVCAVVQAATPTVSEEWIATSGVIQIFTTPVYSTNTTTNATRITKYNHYIVFKNITFNKPSGNQLYETYVFGNYKTDATTLPLNFSSDGVTVCSSGSYLYNFNGNESLVLTIPSSLYPNEIGTKSSLINSTNKLTYKLFTSALSSSYFCTTTTPTTPILNQEWNAIDGVSNTSGIIEIVTTTESAATFRHTVHLKKVTLKRNNNTFYLADDYTYGSFVTP